jgi:fumarate hydratase subunit beta
MKKYGAVYFGAIGGSGALLAKRIVAAEVIAYPELGPEAVRRLEVKDFPVMVIIDQEGNNLYETGRAQYRRI